MSMDLPYANATSCAAGDAGILRMETRAGARAGQIKEVDAGMTRKWLPDEWMDEVIPQMADDPNGFLKRLDDGSWQIEPLEEEQHEGNEWMVKRLAFGDTAGFFYCENYGEFVLKIAVDAAYERQVSSVPPLPAGTTHIWCCGDIFDTLEEFADEGAEDGAEFTAGFWSGKINFVLTDMGGGTARLVEVKAQ